MNADLSEKGLRVFFKEWEIPLVTKLLFEAENEAKALRTSQLTEFTQKQGNNISRASVINTLKRLEEEGLLKSTEEPGKGGFHTLYWRAKTLQEFLVEVNDLFNARTLEIVKAYDLRFVV